VRITFSGGLIARIETETQPGPGCECAGVAIPGLSNLHSHAFQRGMAGLAETRGPEGDNFWTWREVMYRFLDRLGPDDVEAISALAYVEMLERGFTRVGEFHYLHNDTAGRPYADIAELTHRVIAAAQAAGIALTLLPVFYAHGNFGGAPPSAGQRRFLSDPDSFADLVAASRLALAGIPDAGLGVAPHSLRAATPEELVRIVALAPEGPIHIHAAEQIREVNDCIQWSGARPVEWLLDHADIDRRWCLVHATHMTAEEIRTLAKTGAVAGLCPVTEANLGDGFFPAGDYLAAQGAIGIGSDSNVLIDAAGELRALEYAQRLSLRARNVLAPRPGQSSGRFLFDGALAGGAQALGQPSTGLCEGAPADIVSFDPADPAYAGHVGDRLLDSWIFAGGPVDAVWRRGQKLVSGGRHHRRPEIARRFTAAVTRIVA
jgi:formiminoglutamate deiminase